MHDGFAHAISALGVTLLHFLWQGTLLGLGTALILSTLGHAKSQTRYAISCFAMLACGALVLITFTTTFMASPDLAGTFYAVSTSSPQANQLTETAFKPMPWAALKPGGFLAPWLVGIWAVGASFMLLRLMLGLAWVQRLQNNPQPTCLTWQSRCDAMAAQFGVRSRVLVRIADALDTPIAAGWWRPMIVLPAGLLSGLPANYIEALLAHELAHIRRHDYLVNLLQSTLEALLFYHPVTWWISRQIRRERELIADQLAAEVTGAPQELARALSALSDYQAASQLTHNHGLLAQRANGGELRARIEQLMRARHCAPSSWLTLLTVFTVVSAGIASVAFAQITGVAPARHSVGANVRASEHAVRISYALVRSDNPNILAWGPDDDIDAAAASLPKAASDFILVRRNGKEFLLTDPSLIAPARQIWSQAQAQEQQLEVLDQQLFAQQEALQVREQQLQRNSDDAAMLLRNEANANAELAQMEIQFTQRAREVQQSYQQTENYLHLVIDKAVSDDLATPVRRTAS